MSDDSIEKFIDNLGITYNLSISKSYRDTVGRKSVCIEIIVNYKNIPQYIQYHCYNFRNGKIVYDQGNQVMGVKEGVLAYLGDNSAVDNYFDNKSRILAKQFFEKEFYEG